MYLTLEVRWFYPGPPLDQVVDWLEARACLPAAEPPRRDHYLRLGGQPSLGIKLRQGNVEVKTRLEDPRALEVGPGAVGRVARWRKWSFPLAQQAGPLERLLVPAPAWIAVDKERRIQRYRLAPGLRAASVPPEAPAEAGCEFELSRVQVQGEEWWSVSFEAFGSGPMLEQALLAVAAKVLGRGWPISLEVEHSFGYPAWLGHFGQAA